MKRSTPSAYSRPCLLLGGLFLLRARSRDRERRRDGLVVDELEIHHLGSVALTRAEPHDARVAAGPIREARSDVGEERVHDVVRAKRGERLPSGMEIAALAQT